MLRSLHLRKYHRQSYSHPIDKSSIGNRVNKCESSLGNWSISLTKCENDSRDWNVGAMYMHVSVDT